MNRIELPDNYYIRADDMNVIMEQEYEGTSKDGEPITGVRTIGYFSSIESALKRYILIHIDYDLGDIDIESYVDRVNEIKNDLLNRMVELCG